MKAIIRNPIISGFHPDPSICRKNDDYYIVNSSFEYFPAIPIFHSKDLANWNQIGFAITDSNMIDLNSCASGKGIYAPTIRYNEYDDTFYIITTLVHNDNYYDNETFFIKAKDPAGPWYGYTKVKDAEGIDPSLYFEKDRAWYVGNMRPSPDIKKKRNIYLSEIDIRSGKFIGDRKILLTDGAVHDAVCPEGPHIYRIGEYYYLLIAEGGTGYNHAVSVFRSKNIEGPYEINPRNPIMTHRMQGRNSQFNSIGHADIIQTQKGTWWACMLGLRPYGSYKYRNLGRETFMAPVEWEDEWPVFSPETGRIEAEYNSTLEECIIHEEDSIKDRLPFDFQILRTPSFPICEVEDSKICLLINKYAFPEAAPCAAVVRRQTDMSFEAETEMEFEPENESEEAGVIIEYSTKSYFMFTKTMHGDKVFLTVKNPEGILYEKEIEKGVLRIRITADFLDYHFNVFYHDDWIPVGPVLDGRELSVRDVGFTGVMIGLYGSSNGISSDNQAIYNYFSYKRLDSIKHIIE